jgi:hypothetical protein
MQVLQELVQKVIILLLSGVKTICGLVRMLLYINTELQR